MIDIDQYRQARFRGVPFHYTDASRRFGHRVDVKEYPFQDRSLVTDMGRSTPRFEVLIYLIGDDVLQRRRDLEDAFDMPGPGLLEHPTRGEISVIVETGRDKETVNELGVADYTVTFVLAEEIRRPIAIVDTRAAVIEASVEAVRRSVPAFQLEGLEDTPVVAAAAEDFDTIGGALESLSGTIEGAAPQTLSAAVTDALSGLDFDSALDLMRSVEPAEILDLESFADIAAFGGLEGAFGVAKTAYSKAGEARNFIGEAFGFVERWHSFTTNPTAALNALLGANGLGGFGSLIASLPSLSFLSVDRSTPGAFSIATTTASSVIASNRDTMIAAFDTAAAVTAARLSTQATFETLPAAIAARDAIVAALDNASLSVDRLQIASSALSPLTIATQRRSMRALRVSVFRDLTERAANLPQIETYNPTSVQPARVLAYRLAAGTDDAQAMASRSGIPHPSFVPSATPLFFATGASNV